MDTETYIQDTYLLTGLLGGIMGIALASIAFMTSELLGLETWAMPALPLFLSCVTGCVYIWYRARRLESPLERFGDADGE